LQKNANGTHELLPDRIRLSYALHLPRDEYIRQVRFSHNYDGTFALEIDEKNLKESALEFAFAYIALFHVQPRIEEMINLEEHSASIPD
jgi:hypothetical protein